MTDPDRLAEIKAGHYEPLEENPRQGQEIIDWLVGEVERLRDDVTVAMRLAEEEAAEGRRLHGLLARLEWAGLLCSSAGEQEAACPACEHTPAEGHATGAHRLEESCWLAAELRTERP